MNEQTIKLIHNDFYSGYQDFEQDSFDLILTDPPYNRFEEAGQDWDVEISWNRTEGILANLIKPTGWVIVFCDFPLAVELTNTFCHKLEFHGFHIWHKPGGTPAGKTQPIHDTEHILLFRKRGVRVSDMTFNPLTVLPQKQPFTKYNSSPDFSLRRQKKSAVNENKTGERWVKTFLPEVLQGPSRPNMTNDERSGISHPSMKPLVVLQSILRCYSNSGDLILDPFAGSGSTLVAAHNENRGAVGFEIIEKFALEAQERIKRCQAQGDLFRTDKFVTAGKIKTIKEY